MTEPEQENPTFEVEMFAIPSVGELVYLPDDDEEYSVTRRNFHPDIDLVEIQLKASSDKSI
jgi:hypothetical protein